MKSLEVQALTGPDGIAVVERPEPTADESQVLVDVVAAGVSFPDLLQSKGLYQFRPDPPFVPGIEMAGIVRSAPAGSGFSAGDRVCAWTKACLAEVAVCDPNELFALPTGLSFAEGASLIMNYQTAVFCMVHRGGLKAGETVLILGASGGVGTSGAQVAKGIGARVIGLVSSEAKAEVARDAGCDEVVLISDRWKDDVLALTDDVGVDMTYDPVGGDRFLDGVRALRRFGRLVVVGFAAGTIPEIRVNRLLLKNVSLVGAAWGEAAAADPGLARRIHDDELIPLIESGAIKPPIGHVLPLESGQDAYRLLDDREAVGKVVLRMREEETHDH